MKTFLTALVLAAAVGAAPAYAANARHPYSNVDRRNDKGNDTGDSRVDQLNQMQLDNARAGNTATPAPMREPMGQPMAAPSGAR